MRHRIRTSRAFTLIELLTVIAIIAVLVGLLFPAIRAAMLKAEIAKAATAANHLAGAFHQYYTEYGKWPVSTVEPFTMNVDATMVKILQGKGTDPAVSVLPYQGNPRNIVFLEIKAADVDATGAYLDPWKRVYNCTFDTSYDNTIQDPFDNTKTVTAGVLVWSAGPDGLTSATCGDPPGPYLMTPCVNQDNVKSW